MSHSRILAIDLLHESISSRRPPEFISVSNVTKQPVSEEQEQFARAMVLLAFRHLGQLDAVIRGALNKPLAPSKHWVQCALRVGMVQILCSDTPDHASVNETVSAVKQSKYKALSTMVNAVLKKLAAENNALADVSASYNIPDWLYPKLKQQYSGAQLKAMTKIAAIRPQHDINSSLVDPKVLAENASLLRLNESHVRLQDNALLAGLLAENPKLFVQDIAASYPVQMLGDVSDKRVIEIGAAPGGKTMQLLAKGAQVTALDRSASRVKRLEENLQNRALSAQTQVADALEYTPETVPDIVVLDAPCSATGTWRKHPEVLHLLNENEVASLVQVQRALINRAISWLKPGGKLLYCVCSLLPEEGESQTEQVLKEHADMLIMPVENDQILPQAITENGAVRTHLAMLEDRGGMDGFYAVVLEKAG